MRRKVILSLTTIWLMVGMASITPSLGAKDPPLASLKAVGAASPTSSNEVVLRIDGDYTYHTTRATGDTVLVDLKNVKTSGVAKDGVFRTGVVKDYHLLQYLDASGRPVVRVQLNLTQPEAVTAERGTDGLKLVFAPAGTSVAAASAVPAPSPLRGLTSAPTPAPARTEARGPAKVSAVKISSGAAGETYVDISTSGPLHYNVLHLQNPARLVVDLEDAQNAVAQKVYLSQETYLKGVRVGQFREGKPSVVRVVADLSGDPAFDVRAQSGGVRVELKSKTASKAMAVSAPAPPIPAEPAKSETKSVQKTELPHPAEILSAPPATAAIESPKTVPAAVVPPIPPAPVQSTIDAQSTLPALVESREVAAAPKLEKPSAPAPEVVQAARAAMTLSTTPGTVSAAAQDQTAAPGQAQQAVQYTGEPISLNLKDVDLKDFFRLIHEISGLNIIVDPNVSGNVTLVLDAVPWDQALDIVLKNNRLGKTLEGNVLRIARVETLTAEQEANVKLAAAREAAQPLVTVFRPINYAKAATISTILKAWVGGGALTARGNVLVDDRTNTLIISDIQTQIPVIQSIIERLDKKAKQVQIEARIVRATATFSRTLGASISAAYGNRSGTTATAAGTGSGSTANGAGKLPLVTVEPVTGFGVYAIANAGARYAINAAIAAEEIRGRVKTISKPTIVTQNNVAGMVMQGTQIPIQTTINNTISIQYTNAALTMKVTPQVTDDGNIFLDINVTNAAPGVSLTTAGPSIDTQTATTQVLVPDGGTVVFGGVNVTARSKSATSVPLLGSIPVLGNLFKTNSVQDNDQELLFFVSPKVLPG